MSKANTFLTNIERELDTLEEWMKVLTRKQKVELSDSIKRIRTQVGKVRTNLTPTEGEQA